MINYPIIFLALLIAVVLLILFLRRNKKDKKSLGQTLNRPNTKPDEHDEGQRL